MNPCRKFWNPWGISVEIIEKISDKFPGEISKRIIVELSVKTLVEIAGGIPLEITCILEGITESLRSL